MLALAKSHAFLSGLNAMHSNREWIQMKNQSHARLWMDLGEKLAESIEQSWVLFILRLTLDLDLACVCESVLHWSKTGGQTPHQIHLVKNPMLLR
jgi:hypothetical protein